MKVNFAPKFNEKRKITNHYDLKSNFRTGIRPCMKVCQYSLSISFGSVCPAMLLSVQMGFL